MNANEYPADDTQYKDHVLEDVRDEGDAWTFVVDGSLCLSVTKVEGIEPKKGQTVRYYGRGFGHTVRGVFVEGKKIRYMTEAEEEQAHREYVQQQDEQRRADFEKNRASYDARYAALPDVFQKRLDRFRAGNPDFRHKFEPYEMFTCEQAVLFATHLKTVEGLENFRKLPWEEQLKAVPGMDDGHSGNTFGCAIRLAYWYITKPENVVLEHGAMVPLVGCREYGCTHESQE